MRKDVSVSEPIRADAMRASDADRKRVQDQLHWAHAEGLLDLSEFDSRVRSAWDAKTTGELDRVVADLPVPRPKGRRRVFAPGAGGTTMRVLTTIWLSASVANLVIWGLLHLTGWPVYPWWLWVAVPPGAVLGALYASGVGRPRSS